MSPPRLDETNPYSNNLYTGPYNRLEMEAALCLWEEFLSRRKDPLPEDASEWMVDFNKTWDGWGYGQMRQICIDLASHANTLYEALSDDERELFGAHDWEFIPWFVGQTTWKEAERIAPDHSKVLAKAKEELAVIRARNAVLHPR